MKRFALEGWGTVKGSTWSVTEYPVVWTLEFYARKRSPGREPIEMAVHFPLTIGMEALELREAIAIDTIAGRPLSPEEIEEVSFFGGAHDPVELPYLQLIPVTGEDGFDCQLGGISELNDRISGRLRFDFHGPVYLGAVTVQSTEVPIVDEVLEKLNRVHGEGAFTALRKEDGITLLHTSSVYPGQRIPNEGNPTPNRKLSPERQQEILDSIPMQPNERARGL
jgi:hypothetical protein